jgi:hypothetical protein
VADSEWGTESELAAGILIVVLSVVEKAVALQRTKLKMVHQVLWFLVSLVLCISVACSSFEPPNGSRYPELRQIKVLTLIRENQFV